VSFLGWAALQLAASRLGASESLELSFEYAAPSECPQRSAFEAGVQARTEQAELASIAAPLRTFTVTIAASRRGYTGTLEFVDEHGAPASRRVEAAQCSEVVSGMALIAALILDSNVRRASAQAAAVAEPPPLPALPPTAREEPVTLPATTRAAPARAQHADRGRAPTRASLPRPALRVGLGAGATLGHLPSAAGAALFIDLQHSKLNLRLAGNFSPSTRDVDPGRRARLELLAVEASGCVASYVRGVVRITPCLFVELGSLQAEGLASEQLVRASSKTILWAATGPQARAHLGGSAWWVELGAGLSLPLVRHEFIFDTPDARVFEVPALTGRAALGAGLYFL
jgi:hypothetical protein